MDDNTRQVATQAARDVVAEIHERAKRRCFAEDARAGRHDNETIVRFAILGALAAADAVRAETVRECAEVARRAAADKRSGARLAYAAGFRAEQQRLTDEASGAADTECRILALVEQEEQTR